ncbi:alpha/beta hydrolase [Pollutimonas nitritireducens]|uniref:Alpha/beta hydrolase n=1 Tax=Pollutimonas nitritireducens TaxID=2045209 RepID=A0A2N4UDM7_9BURK|nr:alpha/beta hydrolase [Pollutimonas nitritireducens]PLC53130.1 alpha/beta hydrolase [Pollutimonas nitritireducens]
MKQESSSLQPNLVPVHALGRDLLIECQWLGLDRAGKDLVVFLHEGLGSASMWKDWPEQVCDALDCRGLVFSRYGYGLSTPRPHDEKWPVSFMHTQAQDVLPALFEALALEHERPILFGHSDGGSIALLYAAMYPGRVKAIAVAAPHIFVEDVTISNIENAREAYLNTDLPRKLGRYHQDPDSAFWGWNDIWLNPDFRAWSIREYLGKVRCPVLAIQGEDDEYGSLEQIFGIQAVATQTELCILPRCGHSPHRDQPTAVIQTLTTFVAHLDSCIN